MKTRFINWYIVFFEIICVYSTFTFSHSMDDYTGIVFPANNALNMPIDSLPVHSNSQNFINSIGANASLHPDFGNQWENNGMMNQMGIPYNVVGAGQPFLPITFTLYSDESDPGPWPIPKNPFIENVFDWRNPSDGDRHMLIIDSSNYILYETGNITGNSDGTAWEGGCGAIFDLKSNDLRPETWTSADAAGLPIFPLLIRYDEVERAMKEGREIPHAIRFTVGRSQKAYIWPARHFASSSTDVNRPPMGLRFRLKAGFEISGFSPRMQVILKTFKKYGLIVADNGSNWYFQGTHDDRWNDEEINSLKSIQGSDFEAVDISPWMRLPGFNTNSAAVPLPIASPRKKNEKSIKWSGLQLQINYHGSLAFVDINFYLKNAGVVNIELVDMNGRKIQILERKFKSEGQYSASFSAKKFSSGVYCIRLQVGKTVIETGKITITK